MTGVPDLEPASSLRDGLMQLGLELDVQQQTMLLRHLALIQHWNRVYNLTALQEPATMLTQHLLDSLAAVLPLQRQAAANGWLPGATSFLDVGSGAGLPGVAFAVACPEMAVTCVDAVGKKAGFIQHVGIDISLRNLTAVHGRVEAMAPRPWQFIASRAFASLANFTRLTEPLLAADGIWMAMKGKVPTDEIAQLHPLSIDVFHVEPLRVPGLDAERCIVWMRKPR